MSAAQTLSARLNDLNLQDDPRLEAPRAYSRLDALEIDTIEQHGQVACLDPQAGRLGYGQGWKPESALLKPLRPGDFSFILE
jgi:hypothetical protein